MNDISNVKVPLKTRSGNVNIDHLNAILPPSKFVYFNENLHC